MNFLPFIFAIMLLNFSFSDMVLEDDAFHSNLPFHIETWYFEAIFNSNMSIVFMITSFGKYLMVGIQLYENGFPIYDRRRIYTSFNLSDKTPLIYAGKTKIMEGYLKNGKLNYMISYSSEDISLHLYFENKSKGWKSEKWIAVPNMRVEGNIFFNQNEINVSGKGYHDHNIFYPYDLLLQIGYIDGKIIYGNTSIFWAKIFNLVSSETFVIYSNISYHLIEDARVKCKDYVINHNYLIPSSFSIHGKNINITMKSIAIHFIHLPFIHYWRYHYIAEGWIKERGQMKKIKTFDIGECMLFRHDVLS